MHYSKQLSERVNDVLDRAEFPVVLGGDCSILLGNLLALSQRGQYGLLFMDGHTDFYQWIIESTAVFRGKSLKPRCAGLWPLNDGVGLDLAIFNPRLDPTTGK